MQKKAEKGTCIEEGDVTHILTFYLMILNAEGIFPTASIVQSALKTPNIIVHFK